MADPLSISASIVAILQLSGTVIGYLNGVKDASGDRHRLLDEITSISGLLYFLKDRATQSQCGDSCSLTLASLNTPKGPLEQFKSALERLALKLAPVEGWRKAGKALAWPFQNEEIKEILSAIERHKSLFNLALQNDHIGLSQAIKDDVGSLHGKADKLIEGINQLQINQQDQELPNIISWLSPLDFFATQANIYGRWQEGTGQWLLESQVFRDWMNGTQQTLWCPGIPGAGKTVLVSIVVDHLQSTFKDNQIAIAWIYCSYKEKSEQTPVNLIGALLKQLTLQHATVSSSVKSLYEEHRKQSTRPAYREVVQALQSEVERYSRTFIIVDALDECPEDSGFRRDLLQALWSLRNVNLMVTSRDIPAIEREFNGKTRLDIRATEGDVRRYVKGRIPHEHRLLRHVTADPTLQDNMVNTIVSNVDGMFLLARLHMDSFVSKNNRKAIRDTLKHLPKGLDATYDEAMTRIEGQNQEDRELAEKVLSWISHAFRPLSITELQHALAVETGDAEIDLDALPDEEILISVYAGLAILDKESSTVRLVHYTTQAYFERTRLKRFPNAQLEITVTCLTYLSFDVFAEGHCSTDEIFENRLQQNPFLNYAARYWGDHASGDAYAEQGIQDLALYFLVDDCKVSSSSQVRFIPNYRFSGYSQRVQLGFSAIHLVSFLGLKHITKLLLEKGVDLQSRDSHGRTPLSIAAENGHEAVVKLLLEKGTDLESKDSNGRTPLSSAAGNGHEAVVKLLLEKETDLESKDNNGWTPLLLAAGNGHEAVVKLLLEKETDLEFKDNDGWTPLSLAAWGGYEAVVKLLLEKGTDLESKDSDGQTPLSLAADNGHETVVKLLLEKGADPESKNNSSWTPLSLAADNGHETVVKLLLEKGADPESKDGDDQTPLSLAAQRGYEAIVRLLLEKGTDLESKDNDGQTPLSLAIWNGHETIIKLLLEKGTDLKSKDSSGRTPLSLAARNGRESIVKLLLEKGTDLESKDNNGRTPLSLAAWGGHETVVKLLLEKGTDPKSKDNDGRTPLWWAAQNDHKAVVKLFRTKS